MIRKLTSGWFTLPEVSVLEGFFLRLMFAILLVFTIRIQITFATEPHPVGLLKLLHKIDNNRTWFTWVADPNNWAIFKGVFFSLLALYVAGVGLPIVLPAIALMHLIPFNLNSSQGYNHHGNQVVNCTIIIQAIAVLFYGFRHKFSFGAPDARLRAWMFVQSQVIITGMYFISVFSKMHNSHGDWLWNCNNVALDMVKTQRQTFLNHLDQAYSQVPDAAFWMLDHPWQARLFFGSGLLLEIFCILALGHRWIAPIVGISLILMHRSIDLLMGGVAFLYNEMLCLIFLVSVPFFAAWVLERLLRDSRARWFAVGGLLLGVPLSFWFQTNPSPTTNTLGGYLLTLVNQLNTWSSLEWSEWRRTLIFVAPACGAAGVLAVIGALIARFVPAPSRGTVS